MSAAERDRDVWLLKVIAVILNIYARSFFGIKRDPNITNGFRHFYQLIMYGKEHFEDDNLGWHIFLTRHSELI